MIVLQTYSTMRVYLGSFCFLYTRFATLPSVLKDDHGKLVMGLIDWLVPSCLTFVHKQAKVCPICLSYHMLSCMMLITLTSQELVATSNSNLTRSMMYLFEMLMSDILEDEKAAKDKNLRSWIMVKEGGRQCVWEGRSESE